jgi:hypothetical protein
MNTVTVSPISARKNAAPLQPVFGGPLPAQLEHAAETFAKSRPG